jgi:ABC-type oligopeptide transport system substrate-binding subunit
MVPPGMPGHRPRIALPCSPSQARLLLAEAGYPDGRNFPALKTLAWQAPINAVIVEYLRAAWREILGVEITWKQLDPRTYLDRLCADVPHIWITAWTADYPDPDSFLRAGRWRERTGWGHAVYDRLVEDARRAMDQGERMRMYREAEMILVDEVPILPLLYPRYHRLVKPWVRRLRISPIGTTNREEIIIDPH